jgi:hypothetical protein
VIGGRYVYWELYPGSRGIIRRRITGRCDAQGFYGLPSSIAFDRVTIDGRRLYYSYRHAVFMVNPTRLHWLPDRGWC